MNMMKKIAKNTFANRTDSAAMLVNPNTAADSAMTRKNCIQNIIAHLPEAKRQNVTLVAFDTRRKRPKDERRVTYRPRP